MNLLKKFIGALALVIFVLVFILFCLALFIDPNRLKPIITNAVMQKTGYQLTIDGKLAWSFYPRIGVKIPRMLLQAPNQNNVFADLQEVTVATSLQKLLRGNTALEGDIYIADARLMNLHATKARIGLHWRNQVLMLQPIIADFYDGTLKGTANARDLSSTSPKWDWNLIFDSIQVQPVLDDLNHNENKLKISGSGVIKTLGTTEGMTQEQIIKNMSGNVVYTISNGAIQGVDLNYFIQTADGIISKLPMPLAKNTNETAFDSITGTTIIKNATANDSFVLVSKAFSAKADGTINLLNQNLDYEVQITPLNTTRIKGTVPVIVEGDLHNPSIKLDMMKLNLLLTKDQLDKVKAKVQDEIKKLPDKVNNLIDKFLK